jgi:hypothetical protein
LEFHVNSDENTGVGGGARHGHLLS